MTQSLLYVGSYFPGGLVEEVAFHSKRSLLDCDIAIFEPPSDIVGSREYQGKTSLDEAESFRFREACDHWRGEVSESLAAGKTVIAFLEPFQDFFVDSGQRKYSGTGRNQKTTIIVEPFDNYRWLPISVVGLTPASGSAIKPGKDLGALRDYWSRFGTLLTYNLYFDDPSIEPLLMTKTGGKAVAGVWRSPSGGALVLVPPIGWDWEALIVEDKKTGEEVWTEEGNKTGHSLRDVLLGMDSTLRGVEGSTAPPDWVDADRYSLARERELRAEVVRLSSQIEALREKSIRKRDEAAEAAKLRGLLYAGGKELERAIILALQTFGFEASGFDNGDSEFDILFESAEGRFLGEAEGKNNRAINVDKLRQLEMNIQEDFDRAEVTEYATGVLFGNAYRLIDPVHRESEFFTAKCVLGARRSGVVLVRTTDLFAPARFVAENPKSKVYARSVRNAIAKSKGSVAVIPEPPGADLVTEEAIVGTD